MGHSQVTPLRPQLTVVQRRHFHPFFFFGLGSGLIVLLAYVLVLPVFLGLLLVIVVMVATYVGFSALSGVLASGIGRAVVAMTGKDTVYFGAYDCTLRVPQTALRKLRKRPDLVHLLGIPVQDMSHLHRELFFRKTWGPAMCEMKFLVQGTKAEGKVRAILAKKNMVTWELLHMEIDIDGLKAVLYDSGHSGSGKLLKTKKHNAEEAFF